MKLCKRDLRELFIGSTMVNVYALNMIIFSHQQLRKRVKVEDVIFDIHGSQPPYLTKPAMVKKKSSSIWRRKRNLFTHQQLCKRIKVKAGALSFCDAEVWEMNARYTT